MATPTDKQLVDHPALLRCIRGSWMVMRAIRGCEGWMVPEWDDASDALREKHARFVLSWVRRHAYRPNMSIVDHADNASMAVGMYAVRAYEANEGPMLDTPRGGDQPYIAAVVARVVKR